HVLGEKHSPAHASVEHVENHPPRRILGSLAVRFFYWMPIGNDSINGTGQSEAIIINGDASGEQVSGQLAQECWHRKDACRKGCNHRKSQVTAYCCHGVASVHCCRAFIHSLLNMGIPLGLDRAGDEKMNCLWVFLD